MKALIISLLLVSGCAHAQSARADIFSKPETFAGRTTKVCGFMIDNANIVESADRDDKLHPGGLSIIKKGPLNTFHRGPICVEGQISYIGCATGNMICTDAAFDYAISVTRIIATRK